MHKKKDLKVRVGISVGDVNGIGPELILKTFSDTRMFETMTPVVFASTRVLSYYRKALNLDIQFMGIMHLKMMAPKRLNVLNLWREVVNIEMGKPTETAGKYAVDSFVKAVESLKKGEIDVLVTAPINKQTVQTDDFDFPGHTDYLAQELDGYPLMFMVSDELKVGLVTDHLPLKYVATQITEEKIKRKVKAMHDSLVRDFAMDKPKIAVLGLNPHCGDGGLIGKEDVTIIEPAILALKEEGYYVFGPYSADGFFRGNKYKEFDAVLAMYHDQGLIPFKILSKGKGVNYTAGLEKIRTSPDHGVAYEITGKGVADPSSFREAVYAAVDIFKRRSEYEELIANRLEKQEEVKLPDIHSEISEQVQREETQNPGEDESE